MTHNIKQKIKKTRERGNALVISLVASAALIGASGLVIDWGRGVWVRTQLQKASDAAALAGASVLPNHEAALEDAKGMVALNFNGPDEETYTPSGNEFKVELVENVPTYLMRIFGRDNVVVVSSSTARAKIRPGGLRGGAWPFSIINPELNSNPNDDLVPSNYGRRYIIEYGEDNVMVSHWAQGYADVPPVPEGNARGWRGALKLGMDGTLDPSAGADDLVYNMLNGWAGTTEIGQKLPIQTGNIDQPVEGARDQLLGADPLPWDDFNPRLHGENGRVVMVPIVHLVNNARQDTYTTQDWLNGAAWDHSGVVIDGFAPFFILTESEQGDVNGDGRLNDGDWVTGYFVHGVETHNFLPPTQGTPDYGLYAPPRLID